MNLAEQIFDRFLEKLPDELGFMKPTLIEIKKHKHENYAEAFDEEGRSYRYCIDCVEKLNKALKGEK